MAKLRNKELKYVSCGYIEHGLDFEHKKLTTCCFTCHSGGGRIDVVNNYHGEPVDWDMVFEQKRKFREAHKAGNITPNCVGCTFLREYDWDDDDYIDRLQFNYWVKCNSRCIYCYAENNKRVFANMVPYNVAPVIEDLANKGYLRDGGEIAFGGGEPTIYPEFDDLVNIFTKNGISNMRVHSSGIKFSSAIENAIKESALNVVVSIDAACPETYKRIKRVDCYDQVMENLKKYAEANTFGYGLMTTKYIIIPHINDNIKEIEGWIQNTRKIGGRWLALDIEDVWYKMNRATISNYYLDLVNYVISRAKDLDMKVELYDRARGLNEGLNLL